MLKDILTDSILRGGKFWTHSLELVGGCTKVSPGCLNCWSEAMAVRFKRCEPFDGGLTIRWHKLAEILPKSANRKPRVWTYWNDIFHESVPDDFREEFFRNCNAGWDYHIICTKRPELAAEYWKAEYTPMNHHIPEMGKIIYLITMENQEMANKRSEHAACLIDMGWHVGALVEPMLEPVVMPWSVGWGWVICGPENGKGKRPFNQEWALRLAYECKRTKTPFYFKGGELNGKYWLEVPNI